MPQFEKKIRLTFELDNNSYPLYERAANRVRARKGKRVSRNVILKELVESYLDQGTSRSRAKHQVLIHTDLEMKHGWYSTERGYLPVDPEVLAAALKERAPILVDKVAVAPTEESTQPNGRYIPTDTVRTLLAITDNRCQECDTGCGPFHIHHEVPLSDGGDHHLQRLRLLCASCHDKEHEADFQSRPNWRAAREHNRGGAFRVNSS